MTTIADVLNPPTADAIYASICADIDAQRVALGLAPVTAAWLPTRLLPEALRGISAAIAASYALAATLGSGYSLSSAEGDMLRLRAQGFEGVTPILADVARGSVTVLNASGAAVTINANADGFRDPTTGIVYLAAETVTVGAGLSAPVAVVGSVAGSSQDAPAGRITQLVSPRTGVSCTNPAPVTGRDTESDPSLRARAALKPIARQPKPTYAKWRDAATDVAAHGVPVTRARVTFTSLLDVRIVLAKSTGGLTAPELAQVSAYLVATVLGDAGGFSCVSASPVAIGTGSTITLWASATDARTDAQIIAAAASAVDREFDSAPIGGWLFGSTRRYPADRITAAIAQIGIIDSDGVPADVSLGAEDVATSSGFSYSVRRVVT